ncbi:hypothetical protein, partial [Klebsiella pneumoniae]|uniref:hypothetical protein n=1 Tax=Klebsiella pneumoniae TaxID=573 RepID=UPI003EBEADA2
KRSTKSIKKLSLVTDRFYIVRDFKVLHLATEETNHIYGLTRLKTVNPPTFFLSCKPDTRLKL